MRKCLILDVYYQQVLDQIYARYDNLESQTYRYQLGTVLYQQFGIGDGFQNAIKAQGWKCDTIIVNSDRLNHAWQRDHVHSGANLLEAQIKHYKPDVLFVMGLWVMTDELRERIRDDVSIVVGHVGSQLESFATSKYDLIISLDPRYVEEFEKVGVKCHYQLLGFNPAMLYVFPHERIYPVTFVGTVSGNHSKRDEILTALDEGDYPFYCWGMGTEKYKAHQGYAFGVDMFEILQQSKIVVNKHIDHIEGLVGNMRMFEATGCKALLITDYGTNLHEMFKTGEVVSYATKEGCLEAVRYYLDHPDEAEKIAKAGHDRTIQNHLYRDRAEELVKIWESML